MKNPRVHSADGGAMLPPEWLALPFEQRWRDDFAGPGGWDEGARELGICPLGIELDESACLTREAAGHLTLHADVAGLDNAAFPPIFGYIGSPPCPTFSSAGKGGGHLLTEIIVRCAHEIAAGGDTRAERREEAYQLLEPIYWQREQAEAWKKKREPDREKSAAMARRDANMSLLVVEPLRAIRDLRPRRVALEQVPPALQLWSLFASFLEAWGYSVWCGVLEAERYGVPQTRERAILVASLDGPVAPPAPTHQRYVSGEPARHEHTLEGELLPWVSMAEALGWKGGVWPAPAPTVSTGGTGSGGGVEIFASREARRRVARATAPREGKR